MSDLAAYVLKEYTINIGRRVLIFTVLYDVIDMNLNLIFNARNGKTSIFNDVKYIPVIIVFIVFLFET